MSRTYRDPIHQEINLDSNDPVEALLIKLIDCKELQRLRWIRQLGTGWFTFHGAEASRFQHSLGAIYIAKLMFDKISKDLNLDIETHLEYKALALCSALLHDIGHGPFSHTCEKINNIMHETWTRELIKNPRTEIHQELEEYQIGLSEKIIAVLNKTYPVKYLSSIVNSQLDCDRFDYLIRDSFYTGTSYGHFDLNRVISSIKANLDYDCLVVGGEKGMLAVEDYLYARYSMYMQVYQHKKCLASDSLLLKLFQRAKLLIKNKRLGFVEEPIYHWLAQPDKLSVEQFLLIDDTSVVHHIKHWINEKDLILKDLARRFIYRDIFKAVKVNNKEELEQLVTEKSQELRKHNMDPEYYLDSITIAANPYSFYNPDTDNFAKAIFVEGSDGELKEISTLSHVVDSLVKNSFANSWFIYADVNQNKTKQVKLELV